MNKLWTFGCSMTAGAELGCNVDHVDFLKTHTKCEDTKSARQKLGDKKYQDKIIKKWHNLIGIDQHDPDLTYAGILSKKFNLELKSCAISGSGLDSAFHEIIKHSSSINWKKDLIILGVTTPGRWVTNTGRQFLFNMLDTSTHRMLDPYLPCIETLDMFHYGTLTLIKKTFPEVNIIRMYNNKLTTDRLGLDLDDIFLGPRELSLDNACLGITSSQYPGGHPIEQVHEKFAKQLLPYFKKINRRRHKS